MRNKIKNTPLVEKKFLIIPVGESASAYVDYCSELEVGLVRVAWYFSSFGLECFIEEIGNEM